MTEQHATQAFYKWEQEQYGDNSPLSDYDRILWVKGYIEGTMQLFEYTCKSFGGGV